MLTALIPTKNHGIYLENLISNVLFAEGSPVWQLLICNDASTDDTAAILARHAGNPRIRVFENKASIGAIASSMTMYPYVETPYVMFMSSDDFFYPEQMGRLFGEMLERDSYVGFGKYTIQDGEQITELQHPGWRARFAEGADDFRALLGFDHYAFLCTTIFRKEFLPKHGVNAIPYDLSLNKKVSVDGLGEFRGHDWNVLIEMAAMHPEKFHFLDEYCGCFRKVASQLSSDEIYVHTGRATFEMALLLLRHLSDYTLRKRIKDSDTFRNAVKNLFYAKFSGVTEQAKQSDNFQQIYKPVILAADTLMNNM
ncbi:glycosyltransferase [Herbaspirillum lusitanum]|jgi:glycosyltransferase involved in cell wall biosynthesis|uniref:Glycosyltransferase n=1 Tax=Herbaspirillum lusitanum TaxID=213312 RepID=A0ABW9A8K9_9BURK